MSLELTQGINQIWICVGNDKIKLSTTQVRSVINTLEDLVQQIERKPSCPACSGCKSDLQYFKQTGLIRPCEKCKGDTL